MVLGQMSDMILLSQQEEDHMAKCGKLKILRIVNLGELMPSKLSYSNYRIWVSIKLTFYSYGKIRSQPGRSPPMNWQDLHFNIIRDLHSQEIGYIHHDIKPDNVLIRQENRTSYQSSLLNLIDYSVCRPIYKSLEDDMNSDDSDEFNGNIVFASPSQKDDIISILYMLIYLRDGDLPWTKNFRLMTMEQNFERILKLKEQFHIEAIQTSPFTFLIQIIDQMPSSGKIEYKFFIQALQNEMKKTNMKIDWIMDWSQPSELPQHSLEHNQHEFSYFLIKDQKVFIRNLQGTTNMASNIIFSSGLEDNPGAIMSDNFNFMISGISSQDIQMSEAPSQGRLKLNQFSINLNDSKSVISQQKSNKFLYSNVQKLNEVNQQLSRKRISQSNKKSFFKGCHFELGKLQQSISQKIDFIQEEIKEEDSNSM
ncbi:ck1 family protein kinase [Stylonychia lemnae]|uniref:Ck1 family protein kinase n=1 Tax=Stylonychia lemnae TaxID=5949 RepID=A0A078AI45_STYLE|nr:ck1 family protein kinase [Stylonychia lemnae]|eukprot:CDW81187.1 ck1 family protein kinase [Stylonychia lemnae]